MAHQLRTINAQSVPPPSHQTHPLNSSPPGSLPRPAREDVAAVNSAVRVHTLQQRQWQAQPAMHTRISAEHTDQIKGDHSIGVCCQ